MHYKWETAITCSWEEIINQQTTSYDDHKMLTHNGKVKLQMHNVNRASEGRRSAGGGGDTSSDLLPSCSDLSGGFSSAAGEGGSTWEACGSSEGLQGNDGSERSEVGVCGGIDLWEDLSGVVVLSLHGEVAEVLHKGLMAWSGGRPSGKGAVQVLRGSGAALPLGLVGCGGSRLCNAVSGGG